MCQKVKLVEDCYKKREEEKCHKQLITTKSDHRVTEVLLREKERKKRIHVSKTPYMYCKMGYKIG